jgi:formylglycine-generating enzyme required for sulfatase activity
LLRQRHGREADLAAIDRELRGKPPGQRQWYINGEGQTLALLHGPVVFDMGSPTTEPERFENEELHRQRIGRSFAVATRKVTVEQFQRFLKAHPEVEHKYSKRYSPDPDGPVISVLWYEAVQYCRWLSEQEGLPEEEMCYPPHAEIKEGMKLPANYLSRTGYRLPTEAEWEYTCRAGAVTAHYYGDDEALLGKYGWYLKNANNRTWPLGRLKPNDFGLFDAHGNVFDWVTDRELPYPTGVEDRPVDDGLDELPISNKANRILRGGSFLNDPFLRCAARFSSQPSTRMNIFGMRVARTVR